MDVVRLLLKTRLRAGQECDREAFFSVLVCIRHTSFPTAAHQVLVNSKICSKVDFVGRKNGRQFCPTTSTWYSWATTLAKAHARAESPNIASMQKKRNDGRNVHVSLSCSDHESKPSSRIAGAQMRVGALEEKSAAHCQDSGEQPRQPRS
jgi:hypothetical protein